MSKHAPLAAKLDESNLFLFTGFEAHGCAGGNVQTHAVSGGAIENQGAIGFEEVVVTANLNRAVTSVLYQCGSDATIDVRFYVAWFDEVFTWVHGS